MGFLRLLLALLVLLSHVSWRWPGNFNWGAAAVASFYLISGAVMVGLLRTHYAQWNRVGGYLLDRLARIYPQYLLWLALTCLAVGAGLHLPTVGEWEWSQFVANLLLLSLGTPWQPEQIWVAPAWSLGTEMAFYLLAPVLLLSGAWRWATALSFGVYVGACLDWYSAEWHGFRMITGAFWAFGLGGMWMNDTRRATWIAWGLILVSCLLLHQLDQLPPHPAYLAWGALVALPIVAWLLTQRDGFWSTWAGNLSYGVFLNHALLIALWEFLDWGVQGWPLFVLVLCSLVLSGLGFWVVEKPVLLWRRSLRVKKKASL